MPFSKSKAATKIQSLFRAAKPRRKYLAKMKRRAWTQMDFYQNEKFRNSRHMRPPPLRRGRGPRDVGYTNAPRHISRAMRVAMFRRRAAADYKYFQKTKKRRNIYRGGAFFS